MFSNNDNDMMSINDNDVRNILMTSLSSHLSPELIAVKQESPSEFHSQKMTVRYKWPKVTPFNSCQLSYQNITTAHKIFPLKRISALKNLSNEIPDGISCPLGY